VRGRVRGREGVRGGREGGREGKRERESEIEREKERESEGTPSTIKSMVVHRTNESPTRGGEDTEINKRWQTEREGGSERARERERV